MIFKEIVTIYSTPLICHQVAAGYVHLLTIHQPCNREHHLLTHQTKWTVIGGNGSFRLSVILHFPSSWDKYMHYYQLDYYCGNALYLSKVHIL